MTHAIRFDLGPMDASADVRRFRMMYPHRCLPLDPHDATCPDCHDDDGDDLCTRCAGSGEGYADGSSCTACCGTGSASEAERRRDYLDARDDAYWRSQRDD